MEAGKHSSNKQASKQASTLIRANQWFYLIPVNLSEVPIACDIFAQYMLLSQNFTHVKRQPRDDMGDVHATTEVRPMG